ncbi:hypothetical protein V7T14_14715 [Segatella copri]|uniref:hypothetical protein n=1 Tax=Segatella copri TaxID=165179 RepID=UPI001C491B76|nr:hypothetical protein [Segatella copri]MBW0032482.1 hypothetical protein [Segatella copri]
MKKTEMRGGAFLKGKEGRVGFRKKSFLAGETERLKKAFINKEGRDDYQVYLPSSQRLQPNERWRNHHINLSQFYQKLRSR